MRRANRAVVSARRRLHVAGWLFFACAGAVAVGQTTSPTDSVGKSATIGKLVERLSEGSLQDKREAAWTLTQFGKAAQPAVGVLIRAATDRDAQLGCGALQALGQIGQAADHALPAILEQLESGDEQRRYRAAFALGHVASADHPAIADGLASESSRVRAGVAEAVGWMGDKAVAHCPSLVGLLNDESETVHAAAMRSLQRLRHVAVPSLQAVLGSTAQPELLSRCLFVVEQIGVEASETEARLIELTASSDTGVRATAVAALASVAHELKKSEDATHAIVASLEDPESEVRRAALGALMRMPAARQSPAALPALGARLDDADPELAQLAALAIGRLDENAIDIIPELISRLAQQFDNASDEDHDAEDALFFPARIALGRLGPVAVPALVSSACSGELEPAAAADVIADMGPRALQTLRVSLASTDANERVVAVSAFHRLAPVRDSLAAMLTGLDDPSPLVRSAAATGLQQLGLAGRAAESRLLVLAGDPAASVRGASLAALTAIGLPDDQAVPIVMEGLLDPDPTVRANAAVAARNLNGLPRQLLLALIDQLRDDTPANRREAARTLAEQESIDADVGQPLTAQLAGQPPETMKLVVQAMGRLAATDEQQVRAIGSILENEDRNVQLAALITLERIGDPAAVVRDSVESLRRVQDATLRAAAIATLAAMLPAEQRIALLVDSLGDDDQAVKQRTAEILADMGREAKPAVPVLIDLMRSGDEVSSEAASSALRRIDAAPAEAVPKLVEILEDDSSDRRERYYALHLLRKAGADARPALPVLHRLRDEADGRIRQYLQRAIDDIEPEKTEAEKTEPEATELGNARSRETN